MSEPGGPGFSLAPGSQQGDIWPDCGCILQFLMEVPAPCPPYKVFTVIFLKTQTDPSPWPLRHAPQLSPASNTALLPREKVRTLCGPPAGPCTAHPPHHPSPSHGGLRPDPWASLPYPLPQQEDNDPHPTEEPRSLCPHLNEPIMLMSALMINNYILKGDTSQGEIFGGQFLPAGKVLMWL